MYKITVMKIGTMKDRTVKKAPRNYISYCNIIL